MYRPPFARPRKARQPPEQPERTKLPSPQTSKLCPHCAQSGKKVNRTRIWQITGPLPLSQCDPVLYRNILRPRLSGAPWLQCWAPLRWLLANPDPPTEGRWFECCVFAWCPRCQTREKVIELCGIRQFPRIRMVKFYGMAVLSRMELLHSFEWVVPRKD